MSLQGGVVFAYDLAVSAGGGVWGPEAAPEGQVRNWLRSSTKWARSIVLINTDTLTHMLTRLKKNVLAHTQGRVRDRAGTGPRHDQLVWTYPLQEGPR